MQRLCQWGYFFSQMPLTVQLLVGEREEKTGMPVLASTLQVRLQHLPNGA
jgi:hypothetical protein